MIRLSCGNIGSKADRHISGRRGKPRDFVGKVKSTHPSFDRVQSKWRGDPAAGRMRRLVEYPDTFPFGGEIEEACSEADDRD